MTVRITPDIEATVRWIEEHPDARLVMDSLLKVLSEREANPPTPTRQSAYNDRLSTDLALAGILRRILRGERWCQQGDLFAIDDSVDLTAGERAAVLQAVREA